MASNVYEESEDRAAFVALIKQGAIDSAYRKPWEAYPTSGIYSAREIGEMLQVDTEKRTRKYLAEMLQQIGVFK